MNIYRQVGAKLAAIRKQRGLSQQSLAELAQISVVYVSNLEKGDKKKGTLETFAKLAKALRVSIADLMADAKVEPLERDEIVSVKGLRDSERKAVEKMIRALLAGKSKVSGKKSR